MKKHIVFLIPVLVLVLALSWVSQVGADCEPTPTPPPTPPPCPGGCTPGYWKNLRKHGDEWAAAGVDPYADFDTTFGVDLHDPDITLFEAVWMGGGGYKKLTRHGTAAYINALHPELGFPLTPEEVIAAIQAGNANMLADLNEELDCPLN